MGTIVALMMWCSDTRIVDSLFRKERELSEPTEKFGSVFLGSVLQSCTGLTTVDSYLLPYNRCSVHIRVVRLTGVPRYGHNRAAWLEIIADAEI